MVSRWVMFGEVVGEVVSTAAPVYQKLALFDAVPNLEEMHIHRLGSALFHSIICDSRGAGVVGLDGGCRLGMAHVLKNRA